MAVSHHDATGSGQTDKRPCIVCENDDDWSGYEHEHECLRESPDSHVIWLEGWAKAHHSMCPPLLWQCPRRPEKNKPLTSNNGEVKRECKTDSG